MNGAKAPLHQLDTRAEEKEEEERPTSPAA
jgi:hypothetical protein